MSDRPCLEASNRKTTPDAAPLLAGLLTTLRQFHAQHVTSYLRLLGQWLRVHVTVRMYARRRGDETSHVA